MKSSQMIPSFSILPVLGRMFLLFLFTSTLNPLVAQKQAQTPPKAAFDRAVSALEEKNYESALFYAHSAKAGYFEENDHQGYLKAIKLSSKIHRKNNNLGEARKEIETAILWINEHPEWQDFNLTSDILQSGAYLLSQSGRIVEALDNYEKAAQFRLRNEKLSADDQEKLRQLYLGAGIQYSRLGQHQRADERMQESYALTVGLYGEGSSEAAHLLCTWSIYLLELNPQKADSILRVAWEIGSHQGDVFRMGVVRVNQGDLAAERKDFEQSREFYQQGLDYFERISVDPDKLVSALHGLGEANLQLKEFDRAGEALGRAWKIASEKDIPIRDKGMLLISIGDLLIARHNPKAALAAFHQAQTCFADSFTNPSLISMPEMAQLSADPWNLVALERKAVAFEAIYPSDSNSSWLAQALRCYYLGFEVVDHARQSFTTLQSHDFLARFSREIYERAIALSLKADGKISRLDGVALAFQFAEKSKARTLLSKMEEQFLPEEGGIPDSILWAGAILEENVRQLELLSGDQPGYWGQLREARYKLETFRGTWEENFPAYFENRGKLPFTGLPDLRQSLLGGGKLLIEYFWGDSSIYAFGLTEREMKIVSIPNSILLNLDLDFLRKFFSNLPEANIHAEKTEFYEKGSRIWNTLVEPFLSFSPQTQSLVIIPDDKLWNIPFGALPESIINSGSPPSWREIPFSIRKYSFQYGVSALFLQKSKKMVTPFSKEGVLWISPEFEEGRRISLPKNELEEIQRIFPQSQFLCGTFVSRDTIAKLIPAWQIPVFFTHGEASNLQPGNSCISLNSARDPGREECLYAYEIGTFRLNSELVVLCACQSGLGKSLPGEGLISLGHEFLNAGCPAVVTTLWKVNATKSARIITEFFRGLQEGKAKSNALQEAKITYIENAPEIQLHPFFWAGLVLVGNDAAISMGNW